MKENITKKQILENFSPRKAVFHERSFVMAFVPVLAVGIVILFLSGALKDWSDGTFSPGLLAIPAGLVSSALLTTALRIRGSVLEKLQAAKAASAILGALAKERKELEQAFFRLVIAFGKVLRNNVPQKEMLEAIGDLSVAYDADKAASINGALPKLCEYLCLVVSQSLRSFPSAVGLAFWVFLSVVMLIPVFSGRGNLLSGSNLATMILVYAFSLIFFVSKNMIQVFGTKGSQIRVSQVLEDLLS